MEDHYAENDKTLEMITAEHAVLIPTLPSVKSTMAYVEAVAVVIGSCHIHSVYEDHENIKIYLNDKRFVDILVNNGVSILGRRMNVDYAIPRADKVLLSNVDPVVPDPVIMKLLGFYGNPVSAIIHEKIATNAEYSHIECGKRKVYMKIFDDKKVPSKINFTYQDVCYQIDVLVERCDSHGIYETASYTIGDISEDENEIDSNLSVKPNVSELRLAAKKQPSAKQLAYRNRGRKKGSNDSAGFAARQIQRRARKRLFTSKKVQRKVSSNQVAIQRKGKAKRMAVKKYLASIGKTDGKKVGVRKYKRKTAFGSNVPVPAIDIEREKEYLNDAEMNADASGITDTSSIASTNELPDRPASQYPLDDEALEQFIFKTRFHREPIQVALEFLGNNKTQEGLDALKSQLLGYLNVCKDPALRLRIKRLVMSMKNARVDERAE